MKEWPDKCVDLVLTDPPYGMNYHSGRYQGVNPHDKLVGDDKYPVDILRECIRIAKRAVYAFCRWDNLPDVPKPKSFVVWTKNNWTAGDLEHAHGRMWEGCLFYPQSGHEFIKRMPDLIHSVRIPHASLLHPTEKPVSLMKRFIRTNIGMTILDPFCGSGTTCVAAKMLGRDYIGIDISEDYCQIARERLKAVDTGVPVKEARKGQLPLF